MSALLDKFSNLMGIDSKDPLEQQFGIVLC